MEGWLEKQTSGLFRKFQARYFAVEGEDLLYYLAEEERDQGARGTITLRGMIAIGETDGDVSGREFWIEMPERIYWFRAETQKERDAWLANLQVWSGGTGTTMDITFPIPRHIVAALIYAINFCDTYGTAVEGLFRIPGLKTTIDEVCRRVYHLAGDASFLMPAPGMTVFDVASVVKKLLRNLPESILTEKGVDGFAGVQGVEMARKMIDSLPLINRELLMSICQTVVHQLEYQMVTLASVKSLSICLSPCLSSRIAKRPISDFTQLLTLVSTQGAALFGMSWHRSSIATDTSATAPPPRVKTAEVATEKAVGSTSVSAKAIIAVSAPIPVKTSPPVPVKVTEWTIDKASPTKTVVAVVAEVVPLEEFYIEPEVVSTRKQASMRGKTVPWKTEESSPDMVRTRTMNSIGDNGAATLAIEAQVRNVSVSGNTDSCIAKDASVEAEGQTDTQPSLKNQDAKDVIISTTTHIETTSRAEDPPTAVRDAATTHVPVLPCGSEAMTAIVGISSPMLKSTAGPIAAAAVAPAAASSWVTSAPSPAVVPPWANAHSSTPGANPTVTRAFSDPQQQASIAGPIAIIELPRASSVPEHQGSLSDIDFGLFDDSDGDNHEEDDSAKDSSLSPEPWSWKQQHKEQPALVETRTTMSRASPARDHESIASLHSSMGPGSGQQIAQPIIIDLPRYDPAREDLPKQADSVPSQSDKSARRGSSSESDRQASGTSSDASSIGYVHSNMSTTKHEPEVQLPPVPAIPSPPGSKSWLVATTPIDNPGQDANLESDRSKGAVDHALARLYDKAPVRQDLTASKIRRLEMSIESLKRTHAIEMSKMEQRANDAELDCKVLEGRFMCGPSSTIHEETQTDETTDTANELLVDRRHLEQAKATIQDWKVRFLHGQARRVTLEASAEKHRLANNELHERLTLLEKENSQLAREKMGLSQDLDSSLTLVESLRQQVRSQANTIASLTATIDNQQIQHEATIISMEQQLQIRTRSLSTNATGALMNPTDCRFDGDETQCLMRKRLEGIKRRVEGQLESSRVNLASIESRAVIGLQESRQRIQRLQGQLRGFEKM